MLPEFKKRIDTLRDILVGAVPSPAGQIEQITYALIYKFMSDIDDRAASLPGGKRTYFTGEYEKYGWHELMAPTLGAHERLTLYREALSNLAKNPGLPELFQGIYQNAYLPFNDPRVLTLFLKEIDNFKHSTSDDIGDAYEYLLQITGAQGDVGQFRTPRHIIKFIVEAVNPTKKDSVLDPAVGTAGFLIAAFNHVKHHHDGVDDITGLPDESETRLTADEKERMNKNYHGFDIDPTMVRTAKVNMYLHGFTTPDIKNHDSLSSEDYWNGRYDVILANPPFMTPKGGIKPHDKFGIVANRAEVLFVDYIASHLKPTGRAGIVVPEGIIFQSGKAYRELRKTLVESSLYAVISLPSGVFMPYTGVKTSILLLDKELVKQRDDILFIDIKHTGVSLGATARKIDSNDLPEALRLIENFQKGIDIQQSALSFVTPKQEVRSSNSYDLKQSSYRKQAKRDHSIEFVTLDNITNITKGMSSSTKTLPGKYKLVLTAAQPKTADHYDFTGEGVAVPLISSLGHGKAEIKRIHKVQGEFALANLLAFIKPKDTNLVDPDYLFYTLDAAKDRLAKLMSGAANVSMNISDLQKFEIPLLPIEIQREIVAELDGYQKIIDAARAIVKTYKPAIKINPDWQETQLGDHLDVLSGFAFKSNLFNNSEKGIPIIRIRDVKPSRTKTFYSGDYDTKFIVHNGDLLIGMDGEFNPTIWQGGDALLNQRVCRLQNFKDLLPSYAFEVIKDELKKIESSTYAVTVKHISAKQIKDITIKLPPLETQREIVAELEAEQQLINANKKLIEIYQQKIKSRIAEIWGE